MYCQLYDLPAGGDKNAAGRQAIALTSPADFSTLFRNRDSVNRTSPGHCHSSRCFFLGVYVMLYRRLFDREPEHALFEFMV
jgi:hypothetical protein